MMLDAGSEKEVVKRSSIAAKYNLTGDVIYRGLASTIFLAVEKGTFLQVGVKVLMKSSFDSEEEHRNAVREIEIHSSLPPHSNVIRVLASEETPDAILLVTPYTPHGDLWQLTKYSQTYCENEVQNCAGQIMSALKFIHSVCGLIHGDIKPQNFLLYRVSKRYCVQLCDFGLAERPDPTSGIITFHGVRGTSGWFAPEMLDHQDYSHSLDLFACGLIFFRMLGGYAPFDPPSKVRQALEFDDRCWCHVTLPCKQQIAQLLSVEPDMRGTAADALEGEWIGGLGPPMPTPEQLQALSAFGPPPNSEVQFWPPGTVPEPHLRNSYANLQSLVDASRGSSDEDDDF
mmetsp:Transcript_49225/g.124969  ORF Transcript_49225/g.124969 Transcript_49225/m.124969 type:complete len:343 (+) Transcript_49225:108-1136(+)